MDGRSGLSLHSYQNILNQMLSDDLPENNYQIVGAIQEFYDPKDRNGELYLYFSVEKI